MDYPNRPLTTVGRGPSPEAGADIGHLIHSISDDLQAIGRDEMALARVEITKALKRAAAEAGAILLGGIVALVGLAMLCAAAVPALEPVIEPLSLRLLLVAVVYMAAGAAVATVFTKRLAHDATPDLGEVSHQAKRTIQAVREGLHHG
jgi:hypothetical protein